MKQLQVNFVGKTHEADCFVFHLSDKGLVLVVLRGYQFSDKIFTIGFGYCFRLRIKNIGQIVVILLLCLSNLDVGHHVHS